MVIITNVARDYNDAISERKKIRPKKTPTNNMVETSQWIKTKWYRIFAYELNSATNIEK